MDEATGLPLRGELVVLRDWRAEDVPLLRTWLDPRQEWHRWDGPYFPRPTAAAADEMCARLLTRIDRADWPIPRQQLVIADARTDLLLGQVSWYFESEVSD